MVKIKNFSIFTVEYSAWGKTNEVFIQVQMVIKYT